MFSKMISFKGQIMFPILKILGERTPTLILIFCQIMTPVSRGAQCKVKPDKVLPDRNKKSSTILNILENKATFHR